MNTTKKIASILSGVVSAFLVTAILAFVVGVASPLSVAAGITAIVAFVQLVFILAGHKPTRLAYMSLLTEVWSQSISENLYQTNEFMQRATDHSMWVSHKTVHLPQAGALPNVEQNRAIFPATIGSRADSELTYSLNQYTTDPILIQNIEELQISYPKRQSVLYNLMMSLKNTMALQTLYTWAGTGASRIVQTSGSTSTLNLPHSTATGSRKMLTIADLTKVKQILDNDNVPQDGRILLLPAYMYNIDLLNISSVAQAYSFGQPVLPTGVVARILGFDIYIRPDVTCFDNTGTPVIKAISGNGAVTTPATTDQGAGIAYHPSFVARALGSITPYFNAGSNGNGLPEYYGSIFSAEVMHGATKLYTSQVGVVSIVQGT